MSFAPYTRGPSQPPPPTPRPSWFADEQRVFFEVSHWTVQTNENTIKTLKNDIQAMKERLRAVILAKRQRNQTLTPELELKHLVSHQTELRRRYDELVKTREELRSRLDHRSNHTAMLRKQAQAVKAIEKDEVPEARLCRMIENKLNKVSLQHSEALSVRRTYEQILSRLKEERSSFDSTQKTLDHSVNSLLEDVHQMKLVEATSRNERDAVRRELWEMREEHTNEEHRHALIIRETHRRVVQTRLAARASHQRTVDQALKDPALLAMQDVASRSRATRDAHDKLDRPMQQTLEELTVRAYKVIQEALGAHSAEEIIEKTKTARSTKRALLAQRSEAERRIQELVDAIASKQKELDMVKYTVPSTSTSAKKTVEASHAQVTTFKSQATTTRRGLEKTSRLLLDVRSGAEHILDQIGSLTEQKMTVEIPGYKSVHDAPLEQVIHAITRHMEHVLAHPMLRDVPDHVVDAATKIILDTREMHETVGPVTLPGRQLEAKLNTQGLQEGAGESDYESSDDEAATTKRGGNRGPTPRKR
jgi:coiled-coil domain-containing protein 151